MIALLAAAAWGGKFHDDHVHADWSWFTVETRFAEVHYPVDRAGVVDGTAAARVVARSVDSLIARIADEIGQWPRSALHVVLVDDADTLTGFTLPHQDWVVLSLFPGNDLTYLRGPSEPFTDTLAHEIGHWLSQKRGGAIAESASYGFDVKGAAELGATGLGLSLTIDDDPPQAWSEGLAEWLSERAGVNHWSAARAANLRSSALAGRLLTWDELQVSRDKSDAGDAELAYQQGYAFASWLTVVYGPDFVPDLLRDVGDRVRFGWGGALRRATGASGRELHAWFLEDLREEAESQAEDVLLLGPATGVPTDPYEPAWLGSLSRRDRFGLRHPRDQEEAREGVGTWELFPRVSADGRWVAESRRGWTVVEGRGDGEWPALTGWPAPEARRAAVWLPTRATEPAAFVAGRDAIVVVAPERVARGGGLHRSGATDYNQLYLVDLADNRVVRHRGGEGAGASRAEDPRRWKVIPGSLRAHRPAVSPDGSAVAFASGPAPAQQLVVCGLDGANRRVLSSFRDDAMFHGLDWSTDGREIVVSLTRNDQTNLWAVDVASGAWRMLLGGGGAELDPSWGPDGVVFSSDVGGDLEIYRLDVRRGRVEQLTRSVDAAYTPVITPAGHLLYAAWTADGFQARVLPRAERLTFDRTPDFVVGVDADEAARDLAFAPPPGDFAPRRYRASRAILPASAAPFLRADVNPGGLGVSGGAWVDVSDALERHELTLWGLVGDDVAAQASWTLAGRFEIWGTWAVDAQFGDGVVERRSMGEVGASLEVPFNDALAFDAAASVATVGATREVPDVTTLRAELTARVGDEPRRDPGATSKTARLTLRAATSNTTTLGSYEYGRATFEADLAFGLGRPAVDERGLRLDLQTYNAVNSRVVAPDEQLRAGGLSLGALRLSALEVSAPLPGYLAYSSRGDAIALGSGAIAVPVAARPRRSAGGYYLERVEVRLGGDAGLAALYDVGVTPLTDVRVDLRVASTLLQSPFDSVVTVAWAPPLDSPAVGPPQPEIDGLPAAGLRLWVGVGTGF